MIMKDFSKPYRMRMKAYTKPIGAHSLARWSDEPLPGSWFGDAVPGQVVYGVLDFDVVGRDDYDLPMIVVSGSASPSDWGDTRFTEFLIFKGNALSNMGESFDVFWWRDQHWVVGRSSGAGYQPAVQFGYGANRVVSVGLFLVRLIGACAGSSDG